jgi:hypothetical protein
MEAWCPASVGVLIPLDFIAAPLSPKSAVLSVVAFLALQPEVEWIETAAAFETSNKHAASITQVTASHPQQPPHHRQRQRVQTSGRS